ncbi:MAG: glycosyltransferase family A protein [Phycisphaerales bacterium]
MTAIIPSRGGPDGSLARCIAALLAERDAKLRVIASIDGHEAPADLEPLTRDGSVTVVTGEPAGPAGARNRGLAHAEGGLVLFLNDDVLPAPRLVDHHRAAHRDGAPKLVLGDGPFAVPSGDRVLDRMTRETALLFFYSDMNGVERDRDWGFRHAWTLNLSVPRSICADFDGRLAQPMFDDLEWAYRVTTEHRTPVLYRPEASATHHHRYEPGQILAREALLGHQALQLHRVNEACATAVFGDRFDGSAQSIEDARALLTEHAADEYARFQATAREPAMSANVHDLFASARGWRMAARAAGFLAAVRSAPPPKAAEVFAAPASA